MISIQASFQVFMKIFRFFILWSLGGHLRSKERLMLLTFQVPSELQYSSDVFVLMDLVCNIFSQLSLLLNIFDSIFCLIFRLIFTLIGFKVCFCQNYILEPILCIDDPLGPQLLQITACNIVIDIDDATLLKFNRDISNVRQNCP